MSEQLETEIGELKQALKIERTENACYHSVFPDPDTARQAKSELTALKQTNAELAAQVAILRACIDDLLHDDVWLKSTSETELARQVEKRTNVRHELRDMPPTAISSLLGPVVEVLAKAVTMASIASDWNLGTDGKIEINEEWVSCYELKKQFDEALSTLRRLLPEKGKEG